jgi:hypothetical protein
LLKGFEMFKQNYYCLISGLSDITIDDIKPRELSLEFKNELEEQLSKNDYNLAQLLYFHYDNENLLNLFFKKNRQFIPLGNYTSEYLDEQIKDPTSIIGYMVYAINDFKFSNSGQFNLSHEIHLQSLFYKYVLKTKNNFLKHWFAFDRDLKNIVSAINCKKYNYDVSKQLISVGDNDEVYNILIKSSPKVELLVDMVPFADEIIKVAESDMDITEKEKALDTIKWKFLDEQTVFNYFTIEKVMSYIIKLEIVERWLKMSEERGRRYLMN